MELRHQQPSAPQLGKQPVKFRPRQYHRDTRTSTRPAILPQVAQVLLQDLLEIEHQGIERLPLGAGSDLLTHSQVRKEITHLGGPGQIW